MSKALMLSWRDRIHSQNITSFFLCLSFFSFFFNSLPVDRSESIASSSMTHPRPCWLLLLLLRRWWVLGSHCAESGCGGSPSTRRHPPSSSSLLLLSPVSRPNVIVHHSWDTFQWSPPPVSPHRHKRTNWHTIDCILNVYICFFFRIFHLVRFFFGYT